MNSPNSVRGPILYFCLGVLTLAGGRLLCFRLGIEGAGALWFALVVGTLFLLLSAMGWYAGLRGWRRQFHLQNQKLADLERAVEETEALKTELDALKQAQNSERPDALTGLMPYTRFQTVLAKSLPEAQRLGQLLALLFVDIDTFSRINRTFGHGAGDDVLREVALRLQKSLGSSASIARFGGDTFTLLVPGRRNLEELAQTTQKVTEVFRAPFHIHFREFFATSSVGFSVFPFDGTDPGTLLKHADAALFRAKKEGGNRVQAYQAVMTLNAQEHLALETALRRSLEREELVLFYQPQLDVGAGRILGAEALLRWKHPQLGMVSPAQFIPLAEQTGLIVPIGEWVLRSACLSWCKWKRLGLVSARLSVNLSPRQLREPGLARTLATIIEETGMDPDFLEMEVTESALMENMELAVKTLSTLRELGIRISIDDFGTGYSSLGSLRSLPIDLLKIDRSFIKNLPEDQDACAIIQTILAMSKSLKLQVIAEGVETLAQRDFLLWYQCYWMQGYLFSPPVPEEKYITMLQDEKPGLFPEEQPVAAPQWVS